LGLAGQQIGLDARIRHRAGISQHSAVRIFEIVGDGPASRAGLLAGDVVLALDREPVTGVDDLVRLLDGSRIGRPVEITVIRGGTRMTVRAVPDERSA
jgi:S1-C subfamily serine protease